MYDVETSRLCACCVYVWHEKRGIGNAQDLPRTMYIHIGKIRDDLMMINCL